MLTERDIKTLASYGIKYPWDPRDALALVEDVIRLRTALRNCASVFWKISGAFDSDDVRHHECLRLKQWAFEESHKRVGNV